jgi:hypothetical protein
MWRIALFGLVLSVAGCGAETWNSLPFTTGSNPNRPTGESENLRRVMGEAVPVQPLTPEPGDIWPGPLPPPPTLQDLEKQSNLQPGPEQPVPGSPDAMQGQRQAPPATRGSSTPPGSTQPGLAPLPKVSPASPSSAPAAKSPGPNPSGRVVQTPSGPGVTSGGTNGYQTMTTPGGGNAIVVPNGNGTSTIIYSDGRIETVPTPR